MEIHTGFSLGMEWLWIEIQSPWQPWKLVLFLPLLTTHSGNTRSADRPPINVEECKLVATAHEACLDVTHFQTVKRKHVFLVFLLKKMLSTVIITSCSACKTS